MAAQDQYVSLRDVVSKLLKGESAAQIFAESSSDVSFEQIRDLEVLINNEKPIASLEKDGQASELKYNLPASTEYQGLHFIILSASGLQGPNYSWFQDQWKASPQAVNFPPPDYTSSTKTSSADQKGNNAKTQSMKSRAPQEVAPHQGISPGPLAVSDYVRQMPSMKGN